MAISEKTDQESLLWRHSSWGEICRVFHINNYSCLLACAQEVFQIRFLVHSLTVNNKHVALKRPCSWPFPSGDAMNSSQRGSGLVFHSGTLQQVKRKENWVSLPIKEKAVAVSSPFRKMSSFLQPLVIQITSLQELEKSSESWLWQTGGASKF